MASNWKQWWCNCCCCCGDGKQDEYEIISGSYDQKRPLLAPTQGHLANLNAFIRIWVETNNASLLACINKALDDLKLDLNLEIKGISLHNTTLGKLHVSVDTLTASETSLLVDLKLSIKEVDIKKDYVPEVTVEALVLDGVARLTMIATEDSPMSELRLSFVSQPKFDFEMNMFLEVTGIQDVIENVIETQIKDKMVHPNYVTVYCRDRQDTKDKVRSELSNVLTSVYSAGQNFKKP